MFLLPQTPSLSHSHSSRSPLAPRSPNDQILNTSLAASALHKPAMRQPQLQSQNSTPMPPSSPITLPNNSNNNLATPPDNIFSYSSTPPPRNTMSSRPGAERSPGLIRGSTNTNVRVPQPRRNLNALVGSADKRADQRRKRYLDGVGGRREERIGEIRGEQVCAHDSLCGKSLKLSRGSLECSFCGVADATPRVSHPAT